jgi:hypothetical protein
MDEEIDLWEAEKVWEEPRSILCASCRNQYFCERRDRYIRAAQHNLPDLTANVVFDIAALVSYRKGLGLGTPFGWGEYGINRREYMRRRELLGPRLEPVGPERFAVEWAAVAKKVNYIPSKTLNLGFRSKTKGYQTGCGIVTASGEWAGAAKTVSNSFKEYTSVSVTKWQVVPSPSIEDWKTRVCPGIIAWTWSEDYEFRQRTIG